MSSDVARPVHTRRRDKGVTVRTSPGSRSLCLGCGFIHCLSIGGRTPVIVDGGMPGISTVSAQRWAYSMPARSRLLLSRSCARAPYAGELTPPPVTAAAFRATRLVGSVFGKTKAVRLCRSVGQRCGGIAPDRSPGDGPNRVDPSVVRRRESSLSPSNSSSPKGNGGGIASSHKDWISFDDGLAATEASLAISLSASVTHSLNA